jgi:hypothetical protein
MNSLPVMKKFPALAQQIPCPCRTGNLLQAFEEAALICTGIA